uniref:Thioredoxin n=1 Tax=Herposiphonia versicolor TaxID=2007163 RepID=A0A1Z1MFJ9_9FLOR|nr:thioredoxin [Herposiphonia versicolor]ARW64746.1 thioredoxin [Herposiphonia versicolor]
MSIIEVIDSNFDSEVIKSNQVVLVDFSAPWCGPCRMIFPIIDEISKEYHNTIKVVQVDTDLNGNIAAKYGIRSIPTLMIFKNGIKVDTVIGAVPRSTLLNTLNKYI